MPRAHIIISTHTTRHLRLTLLGASLQEDSAASVWLTIDNDEGEIRDLARECSREFDLPLTLVWRPRPAEVRVGQVRNNGVRAMLSSARTVEPTDLLWFLDGDSVAPPGMIARVGAVRRGADLIVGGRLCLSEAATRVFDEAALRRGDRAAPIGDEEVEHLQARARRYAWHQRLKPFGLVKMHKPKVLGANHGLSVELFRRINGYDESFLGAWREDDDLGRRVYLAGGRAGVALTDVCVYHLWHPLNPQKRHNWSELPARADASPDARAGRCREGLDSPREQGLLKAQTIVAGRATEEWSIRPAPFAASPA